MSAATAAAPIPLDRFTAHRSNVVIIGRDASGPIVFGGQLGSPAEDVVDFQELIEAATLGFVGRDGLFKALDAFRSAAARRGYFELVADAGLGKTALAAEIVRRYGALCFFADASRGLTSAKQFLRHLCGAIITRYELDYDYLPSRAGEDSTFLDRLLGEAAVKSPPVWVVVDGLDEADRPPANANPLLLPKHLRQNVYFVVTHRPGVQLLTQPDTPRVTHQILRNAPEQQEAIEQYLRQYDERIKTALPHLRPSLGPEALIARIKSASQGNFMYVFSVLADIVAARTTTARPR
jgi:hypothetical protein